MPPAENAFKSRRSDHSPWGVCTHFIYLHSQLQLQISLKKPLIICGDDSLFFFLCSHPFQSLGWPRDSPNDL